ncbi:hypothetical protein [Moorena sp. SIO4G3]|uniref:hypothetical protein n=1 Tax=Moorena sp. SIO4G3 TaxID=2607821 RepID=UPI00142A0E61|nr:hypothetical protein [Moorena sp. SIO4G3]NEO75119.1 hypothetical protein [Moorena sp. SIO4G3]
MRSHPFPHSPLPSLNKPKPYSKQGFQSRFPIPDSRFPIPDSRFPIPCSLLRDPTL